MALGIATLGDRECESAFEGTALIEGDDGREAFVVIGSIETIAMLCPHPNGMPFTGAPRTRQHSRTRLFPRLRCIG